MNNNEKIQETIRIISSNQEYNIYFFNKLIEATNQSKLTSSNEWFNALYHAKLLAPDNTSAMAYIRALISHGMEDNHNFLEVLNDWLDSFLKSDSITCNAMWFIEEVIKLNDDDLVKKCKTLIINKLLNQSTLNDAINSIVYNKNITTFIFTDENIIFQTLKIIINPNNFNIISQDVHTILTFKEQISKFCIESKKNEFSVIVLDHVLSYLKTNPHEFFMADTIDSQRYSFSYGDFIVSFLISMIKSNTKKDNTILIEQLTKIISENEINHIDNTFLLKIIIYVISTIEQYWLSTVIIKHIKFLEELSSIRYAMYHCIIKKCTQEWYSIFPNFENWLANLNYSEQYNNNCEDKKMLHLWALNTKLSLLYPFKSNSTLYNELINKYPYEVQEPTKSFEIKSSRESTNNYINVFKDASIEDIIEYLNGNKEIPAKTDFPDIHLEEAFEQDFQLNNEKYVSQLHYFFFSLNYSYHKSWVLYELSRLIRENETSDYEKILNDILSPQYIDKQYFYSILSLLSSIVDKYPTRLLSYEQQLVEFLSENIASNNDTNEIDNFGGGRNSLFGQCLYILIKLSLTKDKTLLDFTCKINDYKIFLDNPNGLLILGQYLFWLFKHESFLHYFETLDEKAQNLAFSTYFKYTRYINEKIFDMSIKNKFIDAEDNIHPYMNHAMYFYLTDENNYLLELLDNDSSNSKIIEAIVSSLNTYNDQIIKLSAKNKLFEVWNKILAAPRTTNIASRILYNSNLINIQNKDELAIFQKTISLLTLHSIIYEGEAVNLLNKLTANEQFDLILDILLDIADNSPRTYYMNIEYLDNILITLNNQNFKLLYTNLEKFKKLIAKLKTINYPIPANIKT